LTKELLADQTLANCRSRVHIFIFLQKNSRRSQFYANSAAAGRRIRASDFANGTRKTQLANERWAPGTASIFTLTKGF
jgi:hypothetical protein